MTQPTIIGAVPLYIIPEARRQVGRAFWAALADWTTHFCVIVSRAEIRPVSAPVINLERERRRRAKGKTK